jgi:hypothetical protein
MLLTIIPVIGSSPSNLYGRSYRVSLPSAITLTESRDVDIGRTLSISPAAALGIKEGDAHIVRNAGGLA